MRAFPTLLPLLVLTATVGCNAEPEGRRPPDTAMDEPAAPRPPQGIAWVIFGNDTVFAEIADTPQLRERGLMYREELPDGQGMLFVFDSEQTRSFWMRNTFIPLDIAFLDARQIVVDIQQMEPESEELTESARPAMFALEVPEGWFARQEIEVGSQARIVFGRR